MSRAPDRACLSFFREVETQALAHSLVCRSAPRSLVRTPSSNVVDGASLSLIAIIMATLSTANDDHASSNTFDKNNPIIYNGNPGHLPGNLYEYGQWLTREGASLSLVESRSILLPSAKIVVESPLCIPFIKSGLIDKVGGYSYDDP